MIKFKSFKHSIFKRMSSLSAPKIEVYEGVRELSEMTTKDNEDPFHSVYNDHLERV